jgi:hypothetical protein
VGLAIHATTRKLADSDMTWKFPSLRWQDYQDVLHLDSKILDEIEDTIVYRGYFEPKKILSFLKNFLPPHRSQGWTIGHANAILLMFYPFNDAALLIRAPSGKKSKFYRRTTSLRLNEYSELSIFEILDSEIPLQYKRGFNKSPLIAKISQKKQEKNVSNATKIDISKPRTPT